MTKHVIVLLDIDDTQLDYKQSVSGNIVWMGGDATIWQNHLEALSVAGNQCDIIFHFGLGTFKPREDLLSLEVKKELGNLFKSDEKAESNLIYFTNGKPKSTHALSLAKSKIENDYKTVVGKEDVWMLDDLVLVCDEVKKAGYQHIHLFQLQLDSVNKQKEKIVAAFKMLFSAYKLEKMMPNVTFHACDNAEPELLKAVEPAKAFFEAKAIDIAAMVADVTAKAVKAGIKGLD
jgi:hypothetical protein